MLLGLAGVATAGLFALRKNATSDQGGFTTVSLQGRAPLTTWTPPPAAEPFLSAFIASEDLNDLPRYLLARMAQAESNYDPHARGTSGEIGLMQIIPRWHPGVDPSDPFDSIRYAGELMRAHFDRFGSWSHALAAYNWGPTVLASSGLDAAPASTRRYIASITSDVGVA